MCNSQLFSFKDYEPVHILKIINLKIQQAKTKLKIWEFRKKEWDKAKRRGEYAPKI